MNRTFFHRPVLRAGIAHPTDVQPITDWTSSWAEARNALLIAGLAFYNHGLLVISPAATIEMEITYG